MISPKNASVFWTYSYYHNVPFYTAWSCLTFQNYFFIKRRTSTLVQCSVARSHRNAHVSITPHPRHWTPFPVQGRTVQGSCGVIAVKHSLRFHCLASVVCQRAKDKLGNHNNLNQVCLHRRLFLGRRNLLGELLDQTRTQHDAAMAAHLTRYTVASHSRGEHAMNNNVSNNYMNIYQWY